jgi:hypothetical protein
MFSDYHWIKLEIITEVSGKSQNICKSNKASNSTTVQWEGRVIEHFEWINMEIQHFKICELQQMSCSEGNS